MKAITGNRLNDGAVVYLCDDDQWTTQRAKAARFDDDDIAPVLSAAQVRVREITDAYIIDVSADGAPAGRTIIRETIRGAGPTVRGDLGLQAECCA
jgi:Protein of unknown function (DUF2849)